MAIAQNKKAGSVRLADIITVPALVERLAAQGVAVQARAIQKRAKDLGAQQIGRNFVLTPAEAAQIESDLRAPDKRGRKVSSQEE